MGKRTSPTEDELDLRRALELHDLGAAWSEIGDRLIEDQVPRDRAARAVRTARLVVDRAAEHAPPSSVSSVADAMCRLARKAEAAGSWQASVMAWREYTRCLEMAGTDPRHAPISALINEIVNLIEERHLEIDQPTEQAIVKAADRLRVLATKAGRPAKRMPPKPAAVKVADERATELARINAAFGVG